MGKQEKGRPHAKGAAAAQRVNEAAAAEDLAAILECPVCYKPVTSPQILHCCGQTLCGLCLHGCRQHKDECPMCREENPTHSNNRFAENIRQHMQETSHVELGGMYIDKHGGKLEGEFQDGKLNGKGKITYAGGFIREGVFKSGQLNGEGKVTFPDGEIHEGEFKLNVLHEGKIIFNPTPGVGVGMYEGQLNNGEPHGKGKLTFATGRIHEGEFSGGVLREGTATFPDGHIREGEFHVNGNLRKGKITFGDQRPVIWEGEFMDGKLHGMGKVIRKKDGAIMYEGQFKHGKQVVMIDGGKGKYKVVASRSREGEFPNDMGASIREAKKFRNETAAASMRAASSAAAAPVVVDLT